MMGTESTSSRRIATCSYNHSLAHEAKTEIYMSQQSMDYKQVLESAAECVSSTAGFGVIFLLLLLFIYELKDWASLQKLPPGPPSYPIIGNAIELCK